MSNNPHHCARCRVDGVCESVVPFEPEQEHAFAVYWKCQRCEERSLVVSPLGPWLAPASSMCLQCGREGLVGGQACPSCGLLLEEILSAVEAVRPDEELLHAAREEFARGTCRRGLTLLNLVLQRNPWSSEAWSIKGQFFEYLGYQRALKAAMQEAVRLKDTGKTERDRGTGKAWWQFWK